MNYYNEFDPFAAAWLRELIKYGHIPAGDVDERDIRDVTPNDLRKYTQCHFFAGIGGWSHALRLAGWSADRPVWTGSCPCQPFSTAGRGSGFADERHLWPHFFHLICECRPDRVFGEQVASKDGLTWLNLVQADLEGAGYAVGSVDLCAAGVGAPHIRQRLYWSGVRLADTMQPGRPSRWSIAGDGSSTGCSDLSDLADTNDTRLEERRCVRSHDESKLSTIERSGGAESQRLANTDSTDTAQEFKGYDPQHEQRPPLRRGAIITSGSGARSGTGSRDYRQRCVPFGTSERMAHVARPSATNGFWRDAELSTAERSGGAGSERMADTNSERVWPDGSRSAGSTSGTDQREQQERQRVRADIVTISDSVGTRPSATNGFWRDADWLYCRDGKWRPVEPIHVKMVDGLPGSVGHMRADHDQEKQKKIEQYAKNETTRPNEDMSGVLQTDGTEAVQRHLGGSVSFSQEKVLRSSVYVSTYDRAHQSDEPTKQSSTSIVEGSTNLRRVRKDQGGNEALCSPQRSEPSEQQPVEFDDIVRLLPQSLSLAELRGDNKTADFLQVLQNSILSERSLSQTSESVTEIWSSFSEETKNRFRMGFDASRWQRVALFPLASGVTNRVGRLRGYGNAIVPQVAAAFIEACDDSSYQLCDYSI